jgi:serine phosphatase RsbU (regulator of sigma subunit)
MLRDKEGELKVRVAQLRDQQKEIGEIRVSRSIVEEVVNQGRSVLTSDAQHDPRFASSTVTIQGIRSVLAVPLGVGDKIFGMIYADSPLAEARFSQDHLTVLTTLGSVAAIRVENARLMEDDLERSRLERELQLAREIQQRFQPTSPPVVNGFELQGISFPCYEIGGDYYDFIERPDGHIVIALGDVSGKGTSAALLMSSLHASMHAQTSAHQSISETIAAVNKYLAETIPANRFVTLFCAELEPLTGTINFINAGHNPPLIAHASGTMEQLAAGGIPLGILPNAIFQEGRTQLQHGDVLVIYSDGVSETQNQAGEEFGAMRLYDVVARNLDASAAGIRDRIESALTKFAQGTDSVDDLTLVIVKRQAEGVMVAASHG